MFEQVLSGVIGGVVYSFAGFANKPAKEKFDYKKMLTTLVVAAVVGGVAGYMGQDYGMLVNSSMAAGFTAVVQKAVAAVWKKFAKK